MWKIQIDVNISAPDIVRAVEALSDIVRGGQAPGKPAATLPTTREDGDKEGPGKEPEAIPKTATEADGGKADADTGPESATAEPPTAEAVKPADPAAEAVRPADPTPEPAAPAAEPEKVSESVPEKIPTFDELSRAGAWLLDRGKMPELMALIKTFGCDAITQLKESDYPRLAAELRKLGAPL